MQFTRLYQVALTCERHLLYERIEQRSREMVVSGLVQEVKQLRDMGYKPEFSSMQSIGYRHANALLDGECNQSAMMEHLVRDTRRYGKRQMTWFGKNKDLNWFDRNDKKAVVENITRHLSL
jgi:tRNA dimethylallyltransferase